MIPLSTIHGRKVLFVMAVEVEYGACLRSRFTPLMTGVGPVEGAIAVGVALARLEARGELPQLVVSLGSAGSSRLEQAQVYQAGEVGWRDMDASALGFPRGVTPFLDLPAVIPLTLRIPGVAVASLSTGGNIVSGAAYDGIAQDMVDMESYAVLRACQSFGVPMIALRGISDGAEELSHVGDWTRYLHLVDERLAEAVDRMADAIGNGQLRL